MNKIKNDFERQATALEEWAAQIGFGWKKVNNPSRIQEKISDQMRYLLWKRYGDDWENIEYSIQFDSENN